jgi:nucleotide-binding universal stress UspA family protein
MNLLFATDGSRYASAAANFLRLHLDPAAQVRIEVVTVISPPGLTEDCGGSDRHSEDGGRAPTRAHEWLSRARAELGPALAPASIRILEGRPENVLVREARRHDLVVAGVKGCGAAPFFELGRVASGILRDSDCSVLLVRNRRSVGHNGAASRRFLETTPDRAEAGGESGLRVMIPTAPGTDGVPVGWPLLQSFALSRASVEVVTVLDRACHCDRGGREADPKAGNGIVDARDRTRQRLSRTTSRLRLSSGRPRYVLLKGRPAAEIERRALEAGTDLIVVGARKGDPSHPGPLGSTARELTWSSPCSILTVRGSRIGSTIRASITTDTSSGVSPESRFLDRP